jgi:amidase
LTSEQLVSAYLKRIEAYDKQGPAINAIITLNKKALDEARQFDAERKSGRVRGPLHGIPVVLKDNYDTVDMPTTAGSQLLEGHMAKQDAFMVKKLREAGAIPLAKVNLSEFAGSGGSVSGATDPAIIKMGTASRPIDRLRLLLGHRVSRCIFHSGGFAPLAVEWRRSSFGTQSKAADFP